MARWDIFYVQFAYQGEYLSWHLLMKGYLTHVIWWRLYTQSTSCNSDFILPFYCSWISAVSPGVISQNVEKYFSQREGNSQFSGIIFFKSGKEGSAMFLEMLFLSTVLCSLMGNFFFFSASRNLMNIGSMYLSVWYCFQFWLVYMYNTVLSLISYHIMCWKYGKNFPKIKGWGLLSLCGKDLFYICIDGSARL